ncbi:MAG: cell division protein FtsZ, partial [Ignavibacterium sp.]
KEEMNDYISYTVIATGFNSAKSFTSAKASGANTKKKDGLGSNFRSGFMPSIFDTENIDKDDLDTPTILRVNSPKAQLDDEEDEVKETPSGFSIDASRYSWSKQKAERKDDSDDDDESSSFLRMIMD